MKTFYIQWFNEHTGICYTTIKATEYKEAKNWFNSFDATENTLMLIVEV